VVLQANGSTLPSNQQKGLPLWPRDEGQVPNQHVQEVQQAYAQAYAEANGSLSSYHQAAVPLWTRDEGQVPDQHVQEVR
jgi:hypothetical protein